MGRRCSLSSWSEDTSSLAGVPYWTGRHTPGGGAEGDIKGGMAKGWGTHAERPQLSMQGQACPRRPPCRAIRPACVQPELATPDLPLGCGGGTRVSADEALAQLPQMLFRGV